jgi:hypothetical protein
MTANPVLNNDVTGGDDRSKRDSKAKESKKDTNSLVFPNVNEGRPMGGTSSTGGYSKKNEK